MEPSDIESVLQFLRTNHLSTSESALIDDLFEKSNLDATHIHNFLFPPPIKIPAAPRRPPPPLQDLAPSDASSDQEFISLGSSGLGFTDLGPQAIFLVCLNFRDLVCFYLRLKKCFFFFFFF
ncbi:hypothetical protein HanHA300_Chr07g0257941 [Helianthus annuus]|nr:hypothetical protein HanHA300_Chr07g0257941 [Helianthus annuus]KAJ0732537.1 hypothetical protein HanOQP8_Chr07g0264301 [Helianthus annuus]